MIYRTPPIENDLEKKLQQLQDLRGQLGNEASRPGPWMGSLRREVRASSIESSTSIEGYSVDQSEALALTSGESISESDNENRLAVSSYARAMDHVGLMASDPHFTWSDRVILDLHFDACYFQRDKDPGLWRKGNIHVTAAGGGIDYKGPPADDVPGLIGEIVAWLNGGEGDVVVRGAMAHLNFVSVHPFRDGNGRVSRIVQSLVLAREGLISPEFSSIEEYLGTHTSEYYAALREVQAGSYNPERDASGWVAFCVEAHIAQARQRLEQIGRAAERWGLLEEEVERRGWPDRFQIALEQSLHSGSTRGAYCEEADISTATASGDYRRMVDSGLIVQQGRGRSSSYVASPELKKIAGQA